jgi:hypothetical protein
MLPSGNKLTLPLLAIVILEVVPFLSYATFPAFLQLFKCIAEVTFCGGVQHRMRFSLDYLSFVEMASFQSSLQSEKQRKVLWVENESHIVFLNIQVKKAVWEGVLSYFNSRLYVAIILFEVFAHFHAVFLILHSSTWNLLFGMTGRFFVNNFLDIRRNYDHALEFALTYLFRSRWVLTFCALLMLSLPNACITIFMVSVSLFRDLHKFWFWFFVEWISKLHEARYTASNRRT